MGNYSSLHLTSLFRTTPPPANPGRPPPGSLSRILATFQSSLEQRVTLPWPSDCRQLQGGGDWRFLGVEEGEGTVAWAPTKCSPPPRQPHPSHSHFSKSCRMSALAEITVLSDPGGIQKIFKPEEPLGDHGAHPHFTDMATEAQKRKDICSRPYCGS